MSDAMLLATLLAQEVRLTVQGGVVMTVCIALVLALNLFCMRRILSEPHPEEHHHAPLEIDTKDTQD